MGTTPGLRRSSGIATARGSSSKLRGRAAGAVVWRHQPGHGSINFPRYPLSPRLSWLASLQLLLRSLTVELVERLDVAQDCRVALRHKITVQFLQRQRTQRPQFGRLDVFAVQPGELHVFELAQIRHLRGSDVQLNNAGIDKWR